MLRSSSKSPSNLWFMTFQRGEAGLQWFVVLCFGVFSVAFAFSFLVHGLILASTGSRQKVQRAIDRFRKSTCGSQAYTRNLIEKHRKRHNGIIEIDISS